MSPRLILLLAMLLFGGCAEAPPKPLLGIGESNFQQWVLSAYKSPSSSFGRYQFYLACKGDKSAIESIFNAALYDARNPLNGGGEEVARVWEIEAVLSSIGEKSFLSVLEGRYLETQRAVLGPLDQRSLQGAFPNISALRQRLLPKSRK